MLILISVETLCEWITSELLHQNEFGRNMVVVVMELKLNLLKFISKSKVFLVWLNKWVLVFTIYVIHHKWIISHLIWGLNETCLESTICCVEYGFEEMWMVLTPQRRERT